jgi:hypothetical protein
MNSEDITEFAKLMGFAILAVVIAALGIVGIFWAFQAVFGLSDEQRAEMRVPRLLSESDGCRVYKFVDDGAHYFTRCGEQVDTVRHYTESCGKGCIRHRTESIATEGNK